MTGRSEFDREFSNVEPPTEIRLDIEEALEVLAAAEDAAETFHEAGLFVGEAQMRHLVTLLHQRLFV